MRQIMQLYLSPLRKTIQVGGFPPLRPKCHTTVVTPTKMECSAMIIIILAKYMVKPWTSGGFFYSVQNFYHRKFIQPHDGWITNPVTRWFHHTVGFFFVTTITFKDLVYGQSSVETAGLLISWVFLFLTTNHTNLNGSTRGGLLSDHPHGPNHSYSQSPVWD